MAENSRFLRTFMRITAEAAKVWGPADRIDSDTPVVHKHDDAEKASEEQLAEIEVERDAEGHAYAIRKHRDVA
jgi:hypothetical protein